MKVRFLILIVFLNLFTFQCLSKQPNLPKIDTCKYCSQTNDTIAMCRKQMLDLTNRVNSLESRISEIKKPDLPIVIQFAAFIVGLMSFLFTLFLVWAYNTINTKISESKENIKEVKEIIKESKEIIKEANINIKIFETDSKALFSKFESDVAKKVSEFELNSLKVTDEIQNILSTFKNESENIHKIEKELSMQETYLHKSIENLYDLFTLLSNNSKDIELLKLVFIKRAICNIYSFNESERFTGITALAENGTTSEVKHLEYVLLNLDETEKNRLLANDAILRIKTRKAGSK